MNMEENQGQIFRSLVTITAQISPLQTSKNYQKKKSHISKQPFCKLTLKKTKQSI